MVPVFALTHVNPPPWRRGKLGHSKEQSHANRKHRYRVHAADI